MARTITKIDLVQRVADMSGKEPVEVRATVQAVLDAISEYLVEGRRIELRNFGVFAVRKLKARIGRNPNKPKQIVKIPAMPKPVFKAGKILKQRVIARNA